jgi:hypothetical protein
MNPAIATYWFILFFGALGAPVEDMKDGVAVGPMVLEECYAVGATSIDHMNAVHPDKDFAGACWPRQVSARQPGMEILTAQQFVEKFRALKGAAR